MNVYTSFILVIIGFFAGAFGGFLGYDLFGRNSVDFAKTYLH